MCLRTISPNISEVAQYTFLTLHIFGSLSPKELLNGTFESPIFLSLSTPLLLQLITLYRLTFQIVGYSQLFRCWDIANTCFSNQSNQLLLLLTGDRVSDFAHITVKHNIIEVFKNVFSTIFFRPI